MAVEGSDDGEGSASGALTLLPSWIRVIFRGRRLPSPAARDKALETKSAPAVLADDEPFENGRIYPDYPDPDGIEVYQVTVGGKTLYEVRSRGKRVKRTQSRLRALADAARRGPLQVRRKPGSSMAAEPNPEPPSPEGAREPGSRGR